MLQLKTTVKNDFEMERVETNISHTLDDLYND